MTQATLATRKVCIRCERLFTPYLDDEYCDQCWAGYDNTAEETDDGEVPQELVFDEE